MAQLRPKDRVHTLGDEIKLLDQQLTTLVKLTAPKTLALHGVGVITAAELLVAAGQNIDRFDHESAFAHLCGAAPVGMSTLVGMAVQVLGRTPHRPGDEGVLRILSRAPARITSVFISEFDHVDGALLGSFGLRMAVLAMRERSLNRLHDGLLAMALGAVVRIGDDRDLMVHLAVPHVAAVQLDARPADVFETTAARFEEGWLPELLRVFGARADVTLEAFGWRQIVTSDGLDLIST